MPKTFLLIARHYPPYVSGAARRMRGLAEALRGLGHRVYVIAPDLPEGEGGLAVPHPQPTPATGTEGDVFLIERGKRVLRPWLLWPDADVRWAKRAATAFLETRSVDPDWIISSAPPESAHVAGREISAALGKPWAADFRDLWLERPLWEARHNPIRRWGERRIARAICKKADLLIGVDDSIVAEINTFAGTDKAYALPHFAPPISGETWDWPNDKVNIVHTGSFSLSDPDRTIDQLLGPFEAASAQRSELHLHLVGRLTNEEQALIAGSPSAEQISYHGVNPFETSLAMQAAANGLMLVGSPHSAVPPGKFVEYRALQRPVIIAGEARWRADIHPGGESAADLLVKLADGEAVNAPLEPPPGADETARHLLALMDKAQRK